MKITKENFFDTLLLNGFIKEEEHYYKNKNQDGNYSRITAGVGPGDILFSDDEYGTCLYDLTITEHIDAFFTMGYVKFYYQRTNEKDLRVIFQTYDFEEFVSFLQKREVLPQPPEIQAIMQSVIKDNFVKILLANEFKQSDICTYKLFTKDMTIHTVQIDFPQKKFCYETLKDNLTCINIETKDLEEFISFLEKTGLLLQQPTKPFDFRDYFSKYCRRIGLEKGHYIYQKFDEIWFDQWCESDCFTLSNFAKFKCSEKNAHLLIRFLSNLERIN